MVFCCTAPQLGGTGRTKHLNVASKNSSKTVPVTNTRRRFLSQVSLPLIVAAALGGCAQTNVTPLPDLAPANAPKTLTAAQQQQAIQELAAQKAAQEAKALKEIKNSGGTKSP